ncbi:MAG: hypothetical protein KF866_08085 [Phycisphaeraceae bacterium]|nr:hypothetical protein [Phycisphaeraceae bacterium]MCW5753835.1 hypothetical protein [Phycisphaeraceae bacterium]
MSSRVLITGVGAASAYGVGRDALWSGLCSGATGLRRAKRFDPVGFSTRLLGEIEGLSAKDAVPKGYRKAVKVMARDTEMAVVAAQEAVQDAGLVTRYHEGGTPSYPSGRVGCHIGAGLIAAETDELTSALATSTDESGRFDLGRWGAGGIENLQPLWMLKYLPNMLACHVTIVHGCEGPSNTITCAEASGLLSLGESLRVIQRGAADACISGSAESKLNFMGLLRMANAGRLADTGDREDALAFVKPYDPKSAGQLAGEGGGILILERSETAASRNAQPYASVLGFGAAMSPAAVDTLMLAPGAELDPSGVVWSVQSALADAGIMAEDIDAIVPHAAGQTSMDACEAEGLRRVFGDRLSSIPLVTLTPAIGECMAGRAGLQAAVAAVCLREQRLPARLHAGAPEGVLAGSAPSQAARLRRVLVCCSSLGGCHAALVLGAA